MNINLNKLSDSGDLYVFDERYLRECDICYLVDNWDQFTGVYNDLIEEEREEVIWEVSMKEFEMLEAGIEVDDETKMALYSEIIYSEPEEILTEALEIIRKVSYVK